jgi:hypothetical protein
MWWEIKSFGNRDTPPENFGTLAPHSERNPAQFLEEFCSEIQQHSFAAEKAEYLGANTAPNWAVALLRQTHCETEVVRREQPCLRITK